MSGTETPDASAELARAIVRSLARLGVRDVVYCPGSRDAPFAYALAAAEAAGWLRVHVRLDERGAAFTALGLARGAALAGAPAPAVVVTTSGTAVAELHAGLEEANLADVPLIALTADRPVELRGVGASQTTRQAGLFGTTVRQILDVPAGTAPGDGLHGLLRRAAQAATGALGGEPGPVHVNVGFREPLAPASAWLPGPRPAPDRAVEPLDVRRVPWERAVRPGLPTLIVAGQGADPAADRWARAGRIPLLAEPESGLTASPAWVPHQQWLLDAWAGRVRQVVLTGRTTLSRPVRGLLGREGVRLVVATRGPQWADASGRAAAVVRGLAPPRAPQGPDGWLEDWQAAAARARAAVLRVGIGSGADLTLLSAAAAVWRAQGREGAPALVLGASNAIRAVDLVARTPALGPVLANRGLAGIDGTVATALGIAWGSGRPVRVLLGDLTLFHDASSLSRGAQDAPADLQAVVLDDRGGSIFASLEHGRRRFASVYPRFFGVAQRVDLERLAGAYGVRYSRAEDLAALREAMAEPVRGRSLLHVPIPLDPGLLARAASVAREAIVSQQTSSALSSGADAIAPH